MTGKPIPIRLDDEIVQRLDALAQAMSERTGGATITRVNALRAVLLQGLPILEEENGLSRARGKSKKR
jgi:predicted transcriptional regulator